MDYYFYGKLSHFSILWSLLGTQFMPILENQEYSDWDWICIKKYKQTLKY